VTNEVLEASKVQHEGEVNLSELEAASPEGTK
jgi:hypothetical protein